MKTDVLETSRIPVTREGIFLGSAFLVLGITAIALKFWIAGIFLFFCGSFSVFFFRNPYRKITVENGAIVSPADGKVIFADFVEGCGYLNSRMIKISIFMSVFNVHINRLPLTAKVIDKKYNPGRFFIASKDKASIDNEQQSMLLEDNVGNRFVLVQIAGFIARRIRNYADIGDVLSLGYRFGLIRFGSRVDCFIPGHAKLMVRNGQTVKGGVSIIGCLRQTQALF